MRRFLVGLALGATVAPALAAQQYPTTPPAPMALKPAQFPPFQEATLTNGMRLLVVENRKQPVVSLTLALPAGSMHDPAPKAGLAEMVAGLLTKGAGARSAEQISAAIEGVGGSISASATADFLTVNSAVLANDRALAFELLADVVVRPTFPETELELLRKQTLSALALEKGQPDAVARRALAKGLYGEHPYGRRQDERTVAAISRDDLLAFQNTRLKPTGALLVVAGAITLDEARLAAEQAFAGWAGAPATVAASRALPQRARTEILLVHRAGSVQSNLLVGNTTWMPTDPRGYALTLANQILGGAADSRLFLILREQKGWTYGAYSNVTRNKGIGSFTASAEVRTEVTDSALVELLAQMRRIGTEPLPAADLARAQNTLVGQFPLTVETADQVAGRVANARLLGLANDYVQSYRTRLAAVTAAQVQGAARAAMRADAALIVVVGDGAKIHEKLAKIAPVQIVDVEGKPLTPEDLVVKATALEVDLSRLEARTDSFSILIQGNPLGYQTGALTKTADGWQYAERSQIATFVQQQTTVKMSSALAMQSVSQSGTVQGQAVKLEATYAGGKASGVGATPSQTGPKEVKYADVEVPAGAVDDNAVQALLPFFKWAPGATFKITVFASAQGTVQPRTLTVTGEEEVKVPAGTFTSYKVEFTGGEQPGTYWIEKALPHRVIKFGPAAAPLEFVRVK